MNISILLKERFPKQFVFLGELELLQSIFKNCMDKKREGEKIVGKKWYEEIFEAFDDKILQVISFHSDVVDVAGLRFRVNQVNSRLCAKRGNEIISMMFAITGKKEKCIHA